MPFLRFAEMRVPGGCTRVLVSLYCDKSQAERDSVLSEFRSGRCLVLVATDVAARGLDVKDIRVVVNYDFPTWVEDYVHRIGRTGRAGVTSIAYTIFCDNDAKYGSDLVKILEGANQTVSHGHLLMIPMVARDPLAARLEIVQSSAYNSSSGSQYSGNPSFNARYDTTFSGPSVLDEPSLTSSFRTAVTTTRPVAFEASLPD